MTVLELFKVFVSSSLNNRWPSGMKYVVQDGTGTFVGFVEMPDFVMGDWISIGNYEDLGLTAEVGSDFSWTILTESDVFPVQKHLATVQEVSVKWIPGETFPPVGQRVSFWYESSDLDIHNCTYREGVVVYTSDKGATVDIGFLVSSGEVGDFEISKLVKDTEFLAAEIATALGIDAYNNQLKEIAEAIVAGKVPSLKFIKE